MEYLSIGELAERTGVSTRTIRYYEQIGILPAPPRSERGTRRYGTEYLFFVEGALAMKALGLALDEIVVLSKWAMGRASDEEARDAEELVEHELKAVTDHIQLLRRVEALLAKREATGVAVSASSDGELSVEQDAMSIGELAEQTGTSTRTIRYYEELGILPDAPRTAGGTRRYTRDYVFRVRGTLTLKKLGFSLEEVALLARWVQGETDGSADERAARELTRAKLKELDAKIGLLERIQKLLEERKANGHGGPHHLEVMQRIAGGDDSVAMSR